MANLKIETFNMLEQCGKTVSDVRWVGSSAFSIPLELFWRLADTFYDKGYGSPEVAIDLIVVGDDWWLERHEYDGSEWWEYKTIPQKPHDEKTVARLIAGGIGWKTLAEMN